MQPLLQRWAKLYCVHHAGAAGRGVWMIRPHECEVAAVRWEFISTCTLTHRRWAATIARAKPLS